MSKCLSPAGAGVEVGRASGIMAIPWFVRTVGCRKEKATIREPNACLRSRLALGRIPLTRRTAPREWSHHSPAMHRDEAPRVPARMTRVRPRALCPSSAVDNARAHLWTPDAHSGATRGISTRSRARARVRIRFLAGRGIGREFDQWRGLTPSFWEPSSCLRRRCRGGSPSPRRRTAERLSARRTRTSTRTARSTAKHRPGRRRIERTPCGAASATKASRSSRARLPRMERAFPGCSFSARTRWDARASSWRCGQPRSRPTARAPPSTADRS